MIGAVLVEIDNGITVSSRSTQEVPMLTDLFRHVDYSI